MTANHSSRASGQESTDTEIIECGDDAEILDEDDSLVTDGGKAVPFGYEKPERRRDRADSHFCEEVGSTVWVGKDRCPYCGADENYEFATDGGVRQMTPVDDLAADEDPEERLENLAAARARAGATFSYGPVAVRDYPHGENDSVGVDDRPDTMTVEALGDREIFVGVEFGAGGSGDFGATLDEADAVRLARALLLAVDAEAPTRWPTA